jgi:hypothetical protein
MQPVEEIEIYYSCFLTEQEYLHEFKDYMRLRKLEKHPVKAKSRMTQVARCLKVNYNKSHNVRPSWSP